MQRCTNPLSRHELLLIRSKRFAPMGSVLLAIDDMMISVFLPWFCCSWQNPQIPFFCWWQVKLFLYRVGKYKLIVRVHVLNSVPTLLRLQGFPNDRRAQNFVLRCWISQTDVSWTFLDLHPSLGELPQLAVVG
nr:uncharacterized protein LOC127300847 [Lolium perenne]